MMLWLVFLVPLAGGGALLLGPRGRPWLGGASALICGATLMIAVVATTHGTVGMVDWGGPLYLRAALTPMSAVALMLVPVIAGIVVVYASAHEHEEGLRRLVGLLVVFLAGMELILIADDFLTLLIGWEAVGACSWALIGHEWRDAETGRSATYAFIATRLGDLGLFVAAIALFAGTGSFAFGAVAKLSPELLALVAAGTVLSAAAKSGQLPFSPWLFRAMAGPTSVSALLHAATMVAAGAYLMIRLQPMLAAVSWFGAAMITIGLVTAIAGGTVALVQPHAKKLLAASTSAHFGLMFVAIGAGFPVVALFHLVAHALFKSQLFLVAGIAGERAGDFELRHMGFSALMPVVAAASAVGALALAGVPPLGAGWTKEEIVGAAGSQGGTVAILVVLAGMLSAAYATRFHLTAFGIVKLDGGTTYLPSPIEKTMPALLALGSLLLGGLWLGAVHTPLSQRLGGSLPASHVWEIVLSLVMVAIGIGIGVAAARRRDLGTRGTAAAGADWLGLPSLIDRSLTRPVLALATAMATIDDRVVDGGVRATVGLGSLLSRFGANFGENITDGIPALTSRVVATGGRQALRLQDGMTHHYYVLIAGGIVIVVALVLLGT